MNTEDFVTYEQAQDLKSLGFDQPTHDYYFGDKHLRSNEGCYNWNSDANPDDEGSFAYSGMYKSAPTLSQAQKWLYKVKKIYIEISYLEHERKWTFSIIDLKVNKRAYFTMYDDYTEPFDTPESALSKGIDTVLKEK